MIGTRVSFIDSGVGDVCGGCLFIGVLLSSLFPSSLDLDPSFPLALSSLRSGYLIVIIFAILVRLGQ